MSRSLAWLRKSCWIAAFFGFVFVSPVQANTDLDRKYALESIGILRSWDNVDGLFADYVASAYRDYFSHQSRFRLQDLSKSDPILTQSKIPYGKLIADPEILAQLARATRSQTILRTKISKEGSEYRVDLDWLHSPEMVALAHESFTLDEPRDGHGFGAEQLKEKLQQAVDGLIKDVPFVGSVTGRDGQSVTLNIGATSGVERGDTLQIATLEQVKRHPLLKQVVDWRFNETGKVQVEQVDERISFGKIIEEEPNRQIMRQQKVIAIQHLPAPKHKASAEIQEKETQREEPPRIGWVSGGLNLGNFSRSYSSLDNTIGKDGGGFAYGFKVDSQLWITKEWFAETGLNFDFWSYSQHDTLAGSSTDSTNIGSGNLVGFRIAGGYSYLVDNDLLGPKGWLKLGYHSNAYSLPSSTADATTPITFKSLFVGLGGDLPIRDGFGAVLDFNLGIINGASENTKLSGDTNSASDVSFSIGGYYRYTQRISFRGTLDFISNSADFKTNRTVSQKIITFVPAVLYYF